MGAKSVSLASLRHPNKGKNALSSSKKEGKNYVSTSALIAAAKGATYNVKTNASRKMTSQSPLKDSGNISGALGVIGSGGQHYSSTNSSGISGLNRIRSRIGNLQKSPIKVRNIYIRVELEASIFKFAHS